MKDLQKFAPYPGYKHDYRPLAQALVGTTLPYAVFQYLGTLSWVRSVFLFFMFLVSIYGAWTLKHDSRAQWLTPLGHYIKQNRDTNDGFEATVQELIDNVGMNNLPSWLQHQPRDHIVYLIGPIGFTLGSRAPALAT